MEGKIECNEIVYHFYIKLIRWNYVAFDLSRLCSMNAKRKKKEEKHRFLTARVFWATDSDTSISFT